MRGAAASCQTEAVPAQREIAGQQRRYIVRQRLADVVQRHFAGRERGGPPPVGTAGAGAGEGEQQTGERGGRARAMAGHRTAPFHRPLSARCGRILHRARISPRFRPTAICMPDGAG